MTQEIKNHISHLQEVRNVSIADLQEPTGKSWSALRKYRAGITNMSAGTLIKILQFFYNTYGDETTIVITDKIEIETRNVHKRII